MKLKAINCENMGAILVHQQKPERAATDLVAEVHSGFEDAKHIAECVNAAAEQDENAAFLGVQQHKLRFELSASKAEIAELRRSFELAKKNGMLHTGILETWPEDVAGSLDPTAIQGGIAGKPVEVATPKWIDPNDKTQDRYLPHIGEPVLFCCQGKTYLGKHTGGSFQESTPPFRHFDTWGCSWMPLPEPAASVKGGAA